MEMYRLAVLLLLAFLLGSCGSQSQSPPQVSAFYPQDGYHGFERDESISITFSQPMNAAATEAAFQLLDPSGAVVAVDFEWKDGGRRLLARPTSPLAYSPNDQYLNYRYLLSTGAKSQAGAPLENGLDVTFSTMRTLTLVRDSVAALDGAVSARGYVYNDPSDASTNTSARTGDTLADIGLRSFFAFDLDRLALEADRVAYARVSLYNTRQNGAPFGPANLGNLVPERVNYLDDDALAADDYSRPAEAALDPVVAWSAGETATLTVTDWLQTALADGLDYLQLRLRFEHETNGNGVEDTIYPATGEDNDHPPRLEIGYYAP